MAEIKTAFGTFMVDDAEYGANDTQDGARIRLAFLPGEDVDATKLGIVQMANSVVAGTAQALGGNAVIRHHSIPSPEPGAGNHIDQDPSNRNPLYAIDSQPPGNDTLAGGIPEAFYGEIGARFRQADGTVVSKQASLHDMAHLVGVKANCSQKFETTCLAVEGAQAGTYYGAISWGWEKDIHGVLTILPIALVSVDHPTTSFRRAVELWNTSKTTSNEPVVPLPLPIATEQALADRAVAARDAVVRESADRQAAAGRADDDASEDAALAKVANDKMLTAAEDAKRAAAEAAASQESAGRAAAEATALASAAEAAAALAAQRQAAAKEAAAEAAQAEDTAKESAVRTTALLATAAQAAARIAAYEAAASEALARVAAKRAATPPAMPAAVAVAAFVAPPSPPGDETKAEGGG